MYKPLELPPCRICDGEASGIHYGVNTCEACKVRVCLQELMHGHKPTNMLMLIDFGVHTDL